MTKIYWIESSTWKFMVIMFWEKKYIENYGILANSIFTHGKICKPNTHNGLTPKEPDCAFWQHSNFGQVLTNGVFIFFLWNFDYMVQKLLYNLQFSLLNGQSRQLKKFLKKSLFLKIKIWIFFFRFIYTWKALNLFILINEMKVMVVLVCRYFVESYEISILITWF